MVRDKYRIDAFIATGSMANVYAATHRNGSRVALKILHRELARDPQMAERFRREGYFANAIGHPGVVRAIDDDATEDGCAFIVMELLEGENLEDRRVRLGGKLSISEAMVIGDAMLDVLSAAHKQEVLHRDMKPDNVFITKKNEVKLLDFGVARFNDGRSSSDMTAVGMVLGTPAFMPPEQALGRREEVDARSDIWGVGATLFTIITGEAVHAGGDAKTKLIATARKPARPLREVDEHVPRAVASVIDRALAFDKIERWADANAMREALRWARMSITNDPGETLDRHAGAGGGSSKASAIPPPVETKRTPEDEPTLAGTPNPSAGRYSFDDSTARRPPHQPQLRGGEIRGRMPVSDGVITSAPPLARNADPPITQRANRPPSMVPSEDPTFSLRNDPIFSLRRSPEEKDPNDRSPDTERLPRQNQQRVQESSSSFELPKQAPGFQSELPTIDRPVPTTAINAAAVASSRKSGGAPPWGDDAGDIFRAALANTAYADDQLATKPRIDPLVQSQDDTNPRPAAGMPPDPYPTSPAMRTNPGIGPSPNGFASSITNAQPASQRLNQQNLAMTAPMPALGVGMGVNPQMQPQQQQPPHQSAPPGFPSTTPRGHGSFPPTQLALPQYPQQQQQQAYGANDAYPSMPPYENGGQQQHEPYEDGQPRGGVSSSPRPSMTPDNPGPLLATIAPRRSNTMVRVLIPIMIGALAGLGTYVVVVRQRAANANASHTSITTTATTASASNSAMTPAGSSAPSATPSSSASVLASSSSPPPAASSVAIAPVPVKPKRPRRPKIPTAATASATATTEPTSEPTSTPTATPTATAEPTAAPTPTMTAPAPAPTPQDSLPRKDEN